MEIDLSELEGQTFHCIEGCGFCCLLEPQIPQYEVNAFLRDPETKEAVRFGSKGPYFPLQGTTGACTFLRDRKCTIYRHRPHFCRSFPFHVHLLERVQVTLNRTCRGTLDGQGEPAAPKARELLAGFPPRFLEQQLAESRRVYAEFVRTATQEDAFAARDALVRELERAAPRLLTTGGLGAALELGARMSEREAPPEAVAMLRDAARGAPDPTPVVREQAEQLFGTEDLDLPIFPDRDLAWITFRLEGDELSELELSERGAVRTRRTMRFDEVLLPISPEARTVLERHLHTVLKRDLLWGYAAYLVDGVEYEEHVAGVFVEEFGRAAADLWMKSSLVATRAGRRTVSGDDAEDGVVFFDNDWLSVPTVGGVV
ncbi:MAG: YkgJ family cysteine cluster protein [Methanobacteriota archaeon]